FPTGFLYSKRLPAVVCVPGRGTPEGQRNRVQKNAERVEPLDPGDTPENRNGMGNRLFVGNLPYSADEEQLRGLFADGGRQVVDVKSIPDAETGRGRGFAFVELADATQAEAAIGELNGVDFGGRRLVVNEAQERRGGGGGGGRGGFGGGGG